MKEYDIVILGGGPGGYVAAIKACQLGAKTALIEQEQLGGVCLNVGCIPTKTLIKSARVYDELRHADRFGIEIPDITSIKVNMNKLMKRKNEVVQKLTSGVKGLLRQNGVEVYHGFGEALDSNTVLVNEELLKTRHLIVATGSSNLIPDTPGLKESFEEGYAITSTEALSLDKIPEELIIIGGGVIGVEFAALYQALGSRVTILELYSILRSLDNDVRKEMEKILSRKGIQIVSGAEIQRYELDKVFSRVNGEEKIFRGDKILICVGRTANLKGTEKLNLKKDRGHIVTDDRLRTSVAGVYAIGDVNGSYMLAHVASAEGIIAVNNILGIEDRINYDKVPSCIYTFPEVGVAGLTQETAKEQGYKVVTSIFPLAANGKAMADGDTEGFVKLVADERYGEILGVHIIAAHASDMIAEAVATFELEGTVSDLAKAIHPHPTLSEAVMEAAQGAVGKPIHIYKSK